ncbi:MAG: stage II sporulation protein M [Actinomycetota bacterium]|nr:stage II sporulation protein M [Actinomycetota bacterium]
MTNLDRFRRERSADWEELGGLVRDARRRPQGLGPARVRRLGATYRAAAADLALARQRWPGDPTTVWLEELVGRARHLVYASERRRASLRDFFFTGYWRLVRERAGMVALCWALLLIPAALMTVWAATDPPAAAGLLPGDYHTVGERTGGDLGLPVGAQAALAGQILTNNIQVSFLAFAAGIAAGVGTAMVLMYNGVIIGGVAGLAAAAGRPGPFVELVAPHGVLELSVITVAGMAGMTIGWALIDPGRRSRRVAVPIAARRGAQIVLGTAPWFVVAGVVEGFLTPTGLGAGPAVAVGGALGAIYWGLVVWRGRPERSAAATRGPGP